MITLLLVLSILPVLGFGSFVYIMGTDIVKSETHRSSFNILTQMSRQMDETIQRIEEFTNHLAMQTNLINLTKIKQQPGLGTEQASNELRSDLSAFVGSVNGVESVEFFHFDQELIISSQGIFSLDNGFYKDLSWMPFLKQAAADKKQGFWIAPRTAVSLDKQKHEVITYIRLLPLLYTDAKAALLVNLKQDYLRSLIDPLPSDAEGSILVFNAEQRIIVQQGNMPLNNIYRDQLAAIISEKIHSNDKDWDRKTYQLFEPKMFVTFYKSESTNWMYAVLIPVNSVNQSILLLKQVIIISTAVLSLLALITAYFSFSKFQRGILRLLRLFEPGMFSGSKRSLALQDHDYSGQVQYIADNIAHLMNEVVEVRASWKEQLPLLRAHYLLSAILGNMSSLDKMIERYNKEFEMFPNPLFAVQIVEIDAGGNDARFSDKDRPLLQFAVSNIVNELFKHKCRVETVITHDHVIVIFNLPAEAGETFLYEAAEQIRKEVKRYMHHTVTIGIGNCVDPFRELSVSYHEALRALRLSWLKVGDKVLSGGANGETNKLVSYPSFAEEEVLEGIRSMDNAAVAAALERFKTEITRHLLAFDMTKTYYLQLLVAMIRLAQEYEEDLDLVFDGTNPYDAFFKLNDQNLMINWLQQTIVPPIIRLIHSSRKQRREQVISKAFRIVKEHYAQDLSLQMLAEELNMNSSYVSLIFKEETGDTFINYVTKCRVDKAKELLSSTELTLVQIAREVGYANAQHLIRVFKKLENCTPGEYRSARP